MKILKIQASAALLLVLPLTMASSVASSVTAAPTQATQSNNKSTADKPIIDQCPQIDKLSKDATTLKWSAKGRLPGTAWQGFDKSFANSVDHFLGAQWVGVKVGKMICLYQGAEKNTFPIQIVFNKLIEEPTQNPWSKNLKGYRNCVSVNVEDCRFALVKAKKQQDPYQEALGLKDSARKLQPY